MKATLFATALSMGLACLSSLAEGTPKIQFDRIVHDFGEVSEVETVAGTFKFKNVGDGILKLEPPALSCGCTTAGLKSDTLKPGESGELPFTLNLGRARANMEKHITVKSNDPQNPVVVLTLKAIYTPLYDTVPMALVPNLPLGVDLTNQFATITRTDGKPLRIAKLEASKPWIVAKVEPGGKPDAASARIRVEIKRDGSPRRYNEYVHVHAAGQTNGPVSTIFLYGQIMGELSLTPEALYWTLPDSAKTKTEKQDAMMTRRVTIRSANGKKFELKNLRSSIEGLDLKVVPKEPGVEYELVASLRNVPSQTLSGNVSAETSVASQAKIDLPVVVHVYKQ